EFLWSEGHTAHASFEDAAKQVEESMEIYQKLFDALCLSYHVFRRPEHDKFPGAHYTIAYDSPLPNGKVLQIGTTHHLGDSFAKAFDVKFLDKDEETKFVNQTSYGISTRLIAAILSLHGDDQGLILPPFIAPTQIVIIPILFKGKEESVIEMAKSLREEMMGWGYRVELDLRDKNPGWKFAEWEMQGVPLRLEIGPRDVKNNAVLTVRRDTLEKENIAMSELREFIQSKFEEIAINLKERADKTMEDMMRDAKDLDELADIMENNRGVIRSNWCGDVNCANKVKEKVTAEIRGTKEGIKEKPFGNCISCAKKGKFVVYIASAY
ncbi:MAG: His/Gly/Thr/Pro-type tRNA ligase C-terminal domain-containing protein, partial [Candidatus Heimdallarchaeota archaeon]|nr:His/Gly/Thr/Pro-type tRNA ligase C-terminal domain-containing protein [Candidatus Heimdallarchaeota archaeon]